MSEQEEEPFIFGTFELSPKSGPKGFPSHSKINYSFEALDSFVVCFVHVTNGWRIVVVDLAYEQTLSITPPMNEAPFHFEGFYFGTFQGKRETHLLFYAAGKTNC